MEKARILKPRPASHVRRDRKHSIRRQFGITVAEYESYVERFKDEQGGLCAGQCGKVPDKLDHDHETGRIRGLLCRDCNLALGLVHDRPEVARALASYLEN